MSLSLLLHVIELARGRPERPEPSAFDWYEDEIAQAVSWSPMIREFQIHRAFSFARPSNDRAEFRPTSRHRIFATLLLCWGGLIFWFGIPALKENESLGGVLWLLGFGFLMVLGGGIIWFSGGRPRAVFDRTFDAFWFGKGDPRDVGDDERKSDVVSLHTLHALQLLYKEFAQSKSYELNLVYTNAERRHVLTQGISKCMRSEMYALGEFLNVPVWDITQPPLD